MTFKALIAATALSAGAAFATPALAQAQSVAFVEAPVAIASTTALSTGYQQIATQYATQRTTIQQRQQQRQQLAQQFDTDGNGDISDAEVQAAQTSNPAAIQQIQQIDQEIATLSRPIDLARLYVIEQIAMQYNTALQQTATGAGVQLVLTGADVAWAAQNVDLTQRVSTALNSLIPAAQIAPPQGWQPQQQTVQLFQAIQQLLYISAVRQAQQQAAQQPTTQPAPQPQGR